MYSDVRITIDVPTTKYKKTILILFALPNGNTTEHTMGKQMQAGDDWHFDIQHIKVPTDFLRAWYRSRLRMEHPGKEFQFSETRNDSLIFLQKQQR